MAFVVEMTGETQTTLKHSCGNTAETLDDVTDFLAQVTDSDNYARNVTGCLITVETNAIRFAWGADPTVDGGTAFGHILAAAGSLKLTNHKQITDFRFVNKVSGSVAIIHVTPEISKV